MAGNNEVKLKAGDTSKYKKVLSWNADQPRHKKYTMECLSCGHKTQTSIKSFRNSCKKCSSHRLGTNKNTPEETMWMRYKHKAQTAGQVFTITPEVFGQLLHGECFYCGAQPSQVLKLQRTTDNKLTYNGVDRKENDLGYTDSNAVACCWTCNQAKSSMKFADWKELVKRWSERVEKW